MCLALPRGVGFPGRILPPARSCRRGKTRAVSRASVVAWTLLAVGSDAQAETPKLEITEPIVWAAHFEGWVDRLLSAVEIEAARGAPAVSDPEAPYRVLLDLSRQRMLALERTPGLPEDALPSI